MLRYRLDPIGFVFTVNISGKDIHFRDWDATDDCIYYMPLATLVDNGLASYAKNECTVPYANVYLLDDDDRMLLGMPPQYNKAMRLRGQSMLNSSDFAYVIELISDIKGGELLPYDRRGNVVSIRAKRYLLSKEQYELIDRIETFNATPPDSKTADFNMRAFAEIKALAQKAGCALDSYLQNENVYAPDRIKIAVNRDDEGCSLEPTVDLPEQENEKFTDAFLRSRKAQSRYNVQRDNGERVRVVLTPEQKAGMETLKSRGGRHRTIEELKDLIARPTEYFDPEVMDLSELYSDRVIEIGLYKPKFYPFVCPYKSCWIAGANVETPENGTSKVTIENESQLNDLRTAIKEAEKAHTAIVHLGGASMDIDDARFLAYIAEKQLNNPEEPCADEDKTKGRQVLIIEDNTEKLGFHTDKEIEREQAYVLSPNPYLADGFELKEHQAEGVAWLQHLLEYKASGCLMADDMGLGKTLQVLYFIDWHSRIHPQHKPYLIVAPVSLLENWENEYRRFFREPRMEMTRLTSGDIPRQFDKDVVDRIASLKLIITNYETLRKAQLNLCAVDFDIVALDEAQRIKTPGTMVTNAAKALKARFKIALTGTPVENSLLDLWCIMDFCVPGLLGNAKDFAALYQHPLKDSDTDVAALGDQVHTRLGAYFIRRMKVDVAKDLPKKTEVKKAISMPPVQESAYLNIVRAYNKNVKGAMLQTIFSIREVSNHPYLWDKTLFDHDVNALIEASARLQTTVEVLDEIERRGEKVIVFEERKDIQKMIRRVCRERYGLTATIINGDMPPIVKELAVGRMSRQRAIDQFQAADGFNIIIMSPVAAGMGLNVTAANHVIHHSRHWNPAKEGQATDRAYRIGQSKDVFVYYPMAVSEGFKSFDVVLDELLDRKTALATSTIFPTERAEVRPDELSVLLNPTD